VLSVIAGVRFAIACVRPGYQGLGPKNQVLWFRPPH
jgi:hypothetical protein